ncbi:MAG: hypothetical protein V9E99_07635 [Microthrixaceae bacterium]|jgi:hypothetical protein
MTKPRIDPTAAASGSFAQSVERHFPGALPSGDYLQRVRRTIEPLGFLPSRTLPLVSICRDELTTTFFDAIEHEWGLAFTLAGLGGVPALGRTGWKAALSHVPDVDGRGSVLVFGFPHIGIEADGTIGVTVRRGQMSPTATCGALASIFDLAQAGQLPTEIDFDDFEATRLAIRLVDRRVPPASLVDLTVSALDALEVDLWRAIDEAQVWRDHDVTIWCGVQIHAHGEQDWIWPRDAWYAGSDGHRRRFPPDGGPV